ncbi:MAG: hypothetical protein DRJ37_03805 [Thermoprotei archaeon]|nr:MAG: hypothetical protein DRJ37_03805 [Thermoprotei archaeon]
MTLIPLTFKLDRAVILFMEIQVREARREDYAGIVEVHCSDVDKWRRKNGETASYEELTPFERWLHGGPWMDSETIKLHFEILKECGGRAFVAVLGDKVVGEAEIVFSEEPKPYGRYCFLEVLVVHKNYRRRGIGTKLVKYCLEYAERQGYAIFDVIPEDERAKRLYLKLGFSKIFDLCKMRKGCEVGETELLFEEIPPGAHPRDMLLVSGHWYPSIYIWQNILRAQDYNRFKGFNIDRPMFFEIREDGKIGISVFQSHVTKPELCLAYLWVKPQEPTGSSMERIALDVACKAWELGFSEVFVEVDEVHALFFKNVGYRETSRMEYLRRA